MNNFFILFLFFISVIICKGPYPIENEVLLLNEFSFRYAKKEFKYLIILFYETESSLCKEFIPLFEQVAFDLKKENFFFAKIDSIKYIKTKYDDKPLELAVFCNTLEQKNAALACGIKTIYFDNVVRRNLATYKDYDGEILVGGYGGVYHYKDKNPFVTDFSLNVVNWKSVYTLTTLGAKRVTLSHEINLSDINDLLRDYEENTGSLPNLEMIVYGKADMMFTKYCPLKVYGQCGQCKKNKYELRDEYSNFPIISHEDCTTTILNGKSLNLIDDLESIKGVNTFRINLTTEDYNESVRIIEMFKDKIIDMHKTSLFNKETDTRGHFNKEIL